MTPTNQRKTPVERAYSGLVGRPYEPKPAPVPAGSTEPSETPTVATAPKRRGRPPKDNKTMSGRERMQKYRQEKQKKLEDKERRDLVAQLAKIHKRLLPFADPESPIADKVFAERRLRLREIRDKWILLPIEELRKTLQVYEENKDSEGRLPGESSGEADRKNGMSGAEQQLAIVEGEQHGNHGEGPGTAKDNYNTPREPSTRAPRGIQTPKEHVAYLDRREDIITELIRQHVRKISLDEDQPAHRCTLCSAKLSGFSDARQHFWEEYDKGLLLYYRFQELSEDPAVLEMAPQIIGDVRKAYQNHKHLQEVWRVSRERE
jgi:hypothetical protein